MTTFFFCLYRQIFWEIATINKKCTTRTYKYYAHETIFKWSPDPLETDSVDCEVAFEN